MTRKAGQRSETTRAALVRSATAEFARCGFQKASLRTICADAGVTTGALYFFFKNKDDLFREVIAPVEKVFGQLVEYLSEEDFSSGDAGEQGAPAEIGDLLKGLYENQDAVTAVLNNRDAPAVSEFFERAVEAAEKRVGAALSSSEGTGGGYDPFLVHWYAHLQVEMVLHTIEHSASVEEAEAHMRKMAQFVQGGLRAIADGLT